jgi:aminopeptidase N
LAAYVTVDEVATLLGRELESSESDKAEALISYISALVDNYCRRTFSDPVPDAVKGQVCYEVVRALNSSPGLTAETTGDVSYQYVSGSGTLSRAAKDVLNRYRLRFASVRLEGTTYVVESTD